MNEYWKKNSFQELKTFNNEKSFVFQFRWVKVNEKSSKNKKRLKIKNVQHNSQPVGKVI